MRRARAPWPRFPLRVLAVWLTLVAADAPGLAAQTSDETEAVGATVTALEIRSDVPLEDPEEVAALVPIAIGEPLTRDAVRRALRNLQASGIATEIEIHAVPEPPGVRVRVALWADVQVAAVRLEGELGLDEETVRKALAVRAGEPLVENRVLRSVYRVQDLYRGQGYLQGQARVSVDTDEASKAATVTFQVAAGPRTQITAVDFEGELGPFTAKDLLDPLDAEPGSPLIAARVRDDAERLRVFLVRKGHRLAQVDEARQEIEGGGARLVYPVTVGPLVEVTIEGAEYKRLKKRGLLPFLDDEGYDEALVLQAIDGIRRDFQERGYARVRVERREERTPERLALTLVVVPGAQYTLTDVEFRGNVEVPSATLSELMSTGPRRLLRPGSGRLVDEVLRDDLANLRSYYALGGFAEALVGPEELAERELELALTVPVFEGPRTLVEVVELEGIEHLDTGWVRARLPIFAGGPFHPQLLEQALNLVRSEYLDRGFDRAQVVPRLEWNPERTRVSVALLVYEGTQSRVDRVILRGNQVTRDSVVRRFVTLGPGDVVAQRDLLELQRELYRLGIFSRVEVFLARNGDEAADRDVIVRLEEGRVRRLHYGVGYDSEDGVSGLAGYSHANVLGRALAFQVDVRFSEREQQQRMLVRQPYLGPYPIPITYTVYRTDERQPAFDSHRRGSQVEAERRFGDGRRSRIGLLYTYKIVDLELLDTDAEVDRSLRDIQISSLTPSLLLDHRDDPVNPTRGWSTAVQLEGASPLLVADEAFLKFFVQGTYHLPWKRTVLAASLRLGGIEPLDDDAPADPSLPAALEAAEIPISERFFAGGRTSHRAYARDFLGLRGTTLCHGSGRDGSTCPAAGEGDKFLPVGGNGLAVLNLDFRFPIVGGLGGSLFVDHGNVWPRWQDVNPGEAKLGVGAGLRYLTPIGPLRAELGWKLDRERGESPYEIFFSFGNPF